jgi:hypothetical protein
MGVNTTIRISRPLTLAALLAYGSLASLALADTNPPAKSAPAAAPVKPAGPPSGSTPNRFSRHAAEYYSSVWGVDSLSVKIVESGEIVRFAWRVVDATRALPLTDKKAEPSLEDPQAGVSLVVPTMENIGQLRQTQTPEVGRSFWMAFSNKGRLVKHGHRVNVVIGSFRANGLVVE